MEFKKASKENARLRMALTGISGSGKTYTALAVGSNLGGKVAVIDTERGSASKYADIFDFDVLELDTFSPENYIAAVRAAEDAGYEVLIIDSLTHEWSGKGGILEIHDKQTAVVKDSFRAWGKVTPQHNRVLDTILASKCHIIATIRSKSEYSVNKNDGKTVIEKVGLAPVQRDGIEYEFDVLGDLDRNNNLSIVKTRCIALLDKTFQKAGKDVAKVLSEWLSPNGNHVKQSSRDEIQVGILETCKALNTAKDSITWNKAKLNEYTEEAYGAAFEEMGYEFLGKLSADLSDRLASLKA